MDKIKYPFQVVGLVYLCVCVCVRAFVCMCVRVRECERAPAPLRARSASPICEGEEREIMARLFPLTSLRVVNHIDQTSGSVLTSHTHSDTATQTDG